MIVSQSDKLNVIPSLNFGTIRNKNINLNNILTVAPPSPSSQSSSATSSPSTTPKSTTPTSSQSPSAIAISNSLLLLSSSPSSSLNYLVNNNSQNSSSSSSSSSNPYIITSTMVGIGSIGGGSGGGSGNTTPRSYNPNDQNDLKFNLLSSSPSFSSSLVSQAAPNSPSLSPARKMQQLYRDFCSKYLNVSSINIRLSNSQELISISEAIKQRHQINHINLSHNKSIKDLDAWIAFAGALKIPTQTLTQLDLSHNYMGGEGLSPIISDIIRSNRSIQWWNLSFNSLDQDDNNTILDALQHNQTITYLDLSSNDYQSECDVSKKLSTFLESSKSIQHFNFGRNSNNIPLSGLPSSLAINQSLKSIDLSFNSILEKDLYPLFKVLIDSSHINSINLSQTIISTITLPQQQNNQNNQNQQSSNSRSISSNSSNNISKKRNSKSIDSSNRRNSNSISHHHHSSSTTSSLVATIERNTNITYGTHITHYLAKRYMESKLLLDPDLQLDQEDELNRLISLFSNLDHSDNNNQQQQNNENNNNRKGMRLTSNDTTQDLSKICPLVNLNLAGFNFGKKVFNQFLDILNRNQDLQTLDLSSNQLNEENGIMIGDFIRCNESVKVLNISNNEFYESTIDIGDALQSNRGIINLNISNCKSSNLIGKVLAKSLSVNHTLKIVDLSHTKLGASGVLDLAMGMASNRIVLESLNLNDSDLGDKGAQLIGEALSTNTTLTVLYLNLNNIERSGAKSIARSLKKNAYLKILHIGYNAIGCKGAKAMAKSLRMNRTLVDLSLKSCQIADKGASWISEYLKSNSVLEVVNLRGNQLASKGGNSIGKLLQSNHNLTCVDVSNNTIDKDTIQKIYMAMKKNQIITSLNISQAEQLQLQLQQQQNQQLSSSTNSLQQSPSSTSTSTNQQGLTIGGAIESGSVKIGLNSNTINNTSKPYVQPIVELYQKSSSCIHQYSQATGTIELCSPPTLTRQFEGIISPPLSSSAPIIGFDQNKHPQSTGVNTSAPTLSTSLGNQNNQNNNNNSITNSTSTGSIGYLSNSTSSSSSSILSSYSTSTSSNSSSSSLSVINNQNNNVNIPQLVLHNISSINNQSSGSQSSRSNNTATTSTTSNNSPSPLINNKRFSLSKKDLLGMQQALNSGGNNFKDIHQVYGQNKDTHSILLERLDN